MRKICDEMIYAKISVQLDKQGTDEKGKEEKSMPMIT